MSDRGVSLDRAILATATAYVLSAHGSGARTILLERLVHLHSLRAQQNARDDLAQTTDLGAVITASARTCGQMGNAASLGDPEFYLRTALHRYFAGQSQRLAENLGLVSA